MSFSNRTQWKRARKWLLCNHAIGSTTRQHSTSRLFEHGSFRRKRDKGFAITIASRDQDRYTTLEKGRMLQLLVSSSISSKRKAKRQGTQQSILLSSLPFTETARRNVFWIYYSHHRLPSATCFSFLLIIFAFDSRLDESDVVGVCRLWSYGAAVSQTPAARPAGLSDNVFSRFFSVHGTETKYSVRVYVFGYA